MWPPSVELNIMRPNLTPEVLVMRSLRTSLATSIFSLVPPPAASQFM